MFSTHRFSLGEHSDRDSFAGLSYAVGGDLRFPIIGSVSLEVGGSV